MNDTQFQQLADQLMLHIEQKLDEYEGEADIDYEIHGSVMTLTFNGESKIVINRQEPLHQIWLATKKGGYHCDHQQGEWICNRTGRNFFEILSEACSEQSGDSIVIPSVAF